MDESHKVVGRKTAIHPQHPGAKLDIAVAGTAGVQYSASVAGFRFRVGRKHSIQHRQPDHTNRQESTGMSAGGRLRTLLLRYILNYAQNVQSQM